MFKEILYPEQIKILKILKLFSKDFYLAGGTAIALQLGHRKSIDFDLFSKKEINNSKILVDLKKYGFKTERILVDNKKEELTLIIDGVKITFLYYPFDIKLEEKFEGIKLPSLEILGAMKFYTLGRRGKWKDYVDLYTIFSKGFFLKDISKIALDIFDGGYNEKLFREQLCYYEDIDYSEEVEYIGQEMNQEIIKKYLIKFALET